MKFKNREELGDYISERIDNLREKLHSEFSSPYSDFQYELEKEERFLREDEGYNEETLQKALENKRRELFMRFQRQIGIELEREAKQILEKAELEGEES